MSLKETWRGHRLDGFRLPDSMSPPHHPPDAIHLAVPVLYATTGTFYFLTGHIVPMVAAAVYYTLAFVYLMIYIDERKR